MPSLHLTDKAVRALTTEKAQEDVYDASFPAFLVRVGRTGSKVFYFRYRAANGLYRRFRVGRYPALSLAEARDRARGLALQVARDEDPVEDRARLKQAPTLRQVAHQYLERYSKRRKRSWPEDARILEHDVLPYLGDRGVEEIRKREVLEVLERVIERGAPTMANRVFALLHRLFGWACETDLVASNPCQGVRRPSVETARSRILSEAEIRALWQALERENLVTAAALRLLLWSGQRSGEVIRMRWDQISNHAWTIPAELARRGAVHVVPLSTGAQRILAELEGRSPEWVLPSPRGGASLHPKSLGHAVARLRERLQMPHWTPHDLRRTVAFRMAEMGIDELHIARVLGHAHPSVASIDPPSRYLRENREALERWARHLQEIVESQT